MHRVPSCYDRAITNKSEPFCSLHHHHAQSPAHCSACTPPCYACTPPSSTRIAPFYVSTPPCSDVARAFRILNGVPAVCATARLRALCNVPHPPDSVLRRSTPAISDLYLARRQSTRPCSTVAPVVSHEPTPLKLSPTSPASTPSIRSACASFCLLHLPLPPSLPPCRATNPSLPAASWVATITRHATRLFAPVSPSTLPASKRSLTPTATSMTYAVLPSSTPAPALP
ncbi:hypothetical protein B0H13DRAFT_2340505 [Mycena leptocephala]|nr:hypothetical protein B0H13DRAFT_2340505 [Mycena leptocephala]